MEKIIACEINGVKELEFPGKYAKEMKLSEMKKLIIEKLHVPIDHILLCNKKSEEIKYENGDGFIEKAFGQGIVWYKYKVATKIPSDKFKSVTIDQEADHSLAQIKAGNIQNNDMELGEEIDLW